MQEKKDKEMIRNPEKCLLTSLFPELKIPQTRINTVVAGLL